MLTFFQEFPWQPEMGGHFSTSCVETKDVFNPYSEAVLFMAGYKLHICVQMFNSAC